MAATKKDYVAIAAIVQARIVEHTGHFAEQAAIQQVAWDLAHYFGSTNQAFDKARFLRAAASDLGAQS